VFIKVGTGYTFEDEKERVYSENDAIEHTSYRGRNTSFLSKMRVTLKLHYSIHRRVAYGTMKQEQLFLRTMLPSIQSTHMFYQIDRSTRAHMLPQKDVCPLSPTPPSAGGRVKASVGTQLAQRILIRYTHVLGTGYAYEPCALLALLQQAKQEPNGDMTKPCPRCSRTVRVQSTK